MSVKAGAETSDQLPPWSEFEGMDTAEQINALRARGFPARLLRSVASAKLYEKYHERRRALGLEAPRPYWRFQDYDGTYRADPALRAKSRQLDKDYYAEMKALLSEDEVYSEYEQAERQRRFGSLPAEKVRQIEAINKDYAEMRRQVLDQINGIPFPEDKARLVLLEKEKWADVANVLTPAELAEYEMRSSDAASTVRKHLSNFAATEEEFKAVYSVQRKLEAQQDLSLLSFEELRDLREGELKQLLTPERFEEYIVKTNGAYGELSRWAKTADISEQAVADTIRTQRDITRQANSIKSDAALTSSERDANISKLYDEATRRLSGALGEKGFEAYRNSMGGWYNNLKQANDRGRVK